MVKVTRKYSQGLLWVKQPDFPMDPGLYSILQPCLCTRSSLMGDGMTQYSDTLLKGQWYPFLERQVPGWRCLRNHRDHTTLFTTCLPHHNQYTHIYQMSRIHFHSICPFPPCLGPILSKEKMVLLFYLPQLCGFPTNTVEGILSITGYSSFTIEVRQLYFHHL